MRLLQRRLQIAQCCNDIAKWLSLHLKNNLNHLLSSLSIVGDLQAKIKSHQRQIFSWIRVKSLQQRKTIKRQTWAKIVYHWPSLILWRQHSSLLVSLTRQVAKRRSSHRRQTLHLYVTPENQSVGHSEGHQALPEASLWQRLVYSLTRIEDRYYSTPPTSPGQCQLNNPVH